MHVMCCSCVVQVVEILSDVELKGVVINSHKLGQRKNANLPGKGWGRVHRMCTAFVSVYIYVCVYVYVCVCVRVRVCVSAFVFVYVCVHERAQSCQARAGFVCSMCVYLLCVACVCRACVSVFLV
jgi:hypothetical protein